MTSPGDAAPDRSPSDWIVRLHGHRSDADEHAPTTQDAGAIFAGSVIAHRGTDGAGICAVSIHRGAAAPEPDASADVIEFRCEPRDLPESLNAPPTMDLDHVVHVLCSRFEDPEAIERFMDATRGLSDGYIIGREVWLEVLEQSPDPSADADDLVVDDVYLGRYPSLEVWNGLHDLDLWASALDTLEAEAATMFHLVVAPTINRIASYR